jgi:hypothetical protein
MSDDNPQQPLQIDTTMDELLYSNTTSIGAVGIGPADEGCVGFVTPNAMMAGTKARNNTTTTTTTPLSAIRGSHNNNNSHAYTWTPGSNSRTSSNGAGAGGLTMYERSMMQKEERERKMKALQERLMADFTFTPKPAAANLSSNNTLTPSPRPGSPSASSLASSTVSVFTRLYTAETAASRGQRARSIAARGGSGGGYYSATTPVSNGSTPRTVQSAGGGRRNGSGGGSRPPSPRLEEMYKDGEERLRARNLSDHDEITALRKRLEQHELASGKYTFQPQTKWDLAAERRRLAQEVIDKGAGEARKATPKIVKAVRIYSSSCCAVLCCDICPPASSLLSFLVLEYEPVLDHHLIHITPPNFVFATYRNESNEYG